MNENINNNFQCHTCQKTFSTSKVYLWGKDTYSFCQSCNEKNKKKCSWCEKDLNCQSASSFDEKCYLHHHQRSERVNNDNSSEYEYEAFCDQNCESKFNQCQENKPERIIESQKQEELLKQGYKPCQGRGIVPFLVGLEKCGTLIPPTENLCERCKKEQANEKEREKAWDSKNPEKAKVKQEKHQQAQDWWNSLSKEQKQVEIKKLEVEWIKKMGDGDNFNGYYHGPESSIEFKNGRLYVYPEDLSKIPPPLLERFGIQVYPRGVFFDNVGKSFPGYNDNLDNKITNLERELTLARQRNDRDLVKKLEKEIENTKDRSKNNSSSSQPPKKYLIVYIIGGGILMVLTLFIFLIVRKRKVKNPKIK